MGRHRSKPWHWFGVSAPGWSRQGIPVIATARDPESAGELETLDLTVRRLDVSDDASVADFASEIAGVPIDVLINNAGRGEAGPKLDELDFEDMKTTLDVNILGPLRVTRALMPNLLAGKRRIVASISSRLGSISENEEGGSYAYRASKAGLNMANATMAIELESEGFLLCRSPPRLGPNRHGRPERTTLRRGERRRDHPGHRRSLRRKTMAIS